MSKTLMRFIALALLASNLLQQAQCFVPQGQVVHQHPKTSHHIKNFSPLQIPRGGSNTEVRMGGSPLEAVESLLFPALLSGPYGIVAIFAVSVAAVVPLTIYKQMYSISVGYGMAIFLSGLALQLAFQPSLMTIGQAMTAALMFYGIRLATFLFVREQTRNSPSPGASKEGTLVRKFTLAMSVSLFYSFLTTPALYLLRNAANLTSNALVVTKVGLGLAVFGEILEAVADLQKYIVKQSADSGSDNMFQGPTALTYQLCRHPNYLGEIVFWLGVFIAGAPSLASGKEILASVASVLGLYGIVSIMKMATARLEGQQKEKYSGQEKYDTWVKKVKSPLVPFL